MRYEWVNASLSSSDVFSVCTVPHIFHFNNIYSFITTCIRSVSYSQRALTRPSGFSAFKRICLLQQPPTTWQQEHGNISFPFTLSRFTKNYNKLHCWNVAAVISADGQAVIKTDRVPISRYICQIHNLINKNILSFKYQKQRTITKTVLERQFSKKEIL